jgi:hypothetical protein
MTSEVRIRRFTTALVIAAGALILGLVIIAARLPVVDFLCLDVIMQSVQFVGFAIAVAELTFLSIAAFMNVAADRLMVPEWPPSPRLSRSSFEPPARGPRR